MPVLLLPPLLGQATAKQCYNASSQILEPSLFYLQYLFHRQESALLQMLFLNNSVFYQHIKYSSTTSFSCTKIDRFFPAYPPKQTLLNGAPCQHPDVCAKFHILPLTDGSFCLAAPCITLVFISIISSHKGGVTNPVFYFVKEMKMLASTYGADGHS